MRLPFAMCLFPLFTGPIEIPLVPSSPIYAWRRSIGFWLRIVAYAHLLLSVAWFTCFQVRVAQTFGGIPRLCW